MDSIHINGILVERVTTDSLADLNRIREAVGVPVKTLAQFESENWNSWLIKRERAGQPIGMINIVPFRDKERDIGFVLLPEERGSGVLSTILGPFVSQLKAPLYSETGENNIPAKRVLEKAGFNRCDAINKTHCDPTGEEVVTAAFRFLPSV